MDVRAVLDRYPLFNVLDPGWIEEWVTSGERLSVAMGDTLLQAGTPGQHLYLLQEGQVRVLRTSKAHGEVSFGTLGPGHLFGEYALLPPGLNTATCRARAPSRLFRLPLDPLRELLAGRPEIRTYLKRWLRLHALLGYRRGGLFLGFMSPTSLIPFLERLETLRFRATHAVQAEGLCDDRWFVIENGQVALHPAPRSPGPPLLLGPGDCFGARALLDGRRLPLAIAHADTECACLRRESFYEPLTGGASASQQSFREPHAAARGPFVWVGQEEAGDCGAAALTMIARYHGLAISLPEVRRGMAIGPAGISLMALWRAAVALGFRSQAVRLRFEQLTTVKLPAIAHQRDGW